MLTTIIYGLISASNFHFELEFFWSEAIDTFADVSAGMGLHCISNVKILSKFSPDDVV